MEYKAIVFNIFMSLFAICFFVGLILILKVGLFFEINNKPLITSALVSFGIAFVLFLIAMFIDIFWEEK